MAAIIRRHRFSILVIICVLILVTVSWHFRRKEEPILNITPVSQVHENSNDGFKILESGKQFSSDINKVINNMEAKQQRFFNVLDFPRDEEISPLEPPMTVKETDKYQVEDNFNPTQKTTNKITMRLPSQKTAKFVAANEEALRTPEMLPHEMEFHSPPITGKTEKTKYLHLKSSPIAITHSEKTVLLSAKEGFLAKKWKNKNAKKKLATISLTRNGSVTMGSMSTNKDIRLNLRKSLMSIKSNVSSPDKNPILLIDTPGCKIPRLDPWDPTIVDLIELQDPYVCPGPPIFMKSSPGGSISLNKTILETYYNIKPEEMECYYQPIYRSPEVKWVRECSFSLGNLSKLEFGIPLNKDHVIVSCNNEGYSYEQFFPLVPLKNDVELERNSIVPPNPVLNVILLGIDSVSKLNFLRHFPRTHKFLNEKLKAFEMNGYTKVADNTFPNLVPMLTGQFVEYWWNETVMDSMFFDDIGLIWKEYAKRGYRTFFAEDNPFAGIFNYAKRGFNNSPTDYYYRPLALVMEISKYRNQKEKEFCLNSQMEIDIIYNYLKDFAQTMGARPHFGFAMVSSITHDKLNYAGWADEPTVRLMEDLLDSGALNNTLLVLFSDHGLRFGQIRHSYIGKFEERLPLMYIHVPKWFLDKYPKIAKNLQTNQDRLMTLFDIHATMLHVLDLNKTQENLSNMTLGKSLFNEISPHRACEDAHIETHWCPCQEFDIIDSNSSEALNASRAIVDDINSKLEPFQGVCEVLEVDTIMDARLGKANDMMLQFVKTENEVINRTVYVDNDVMPVYDYMITLVAKPGRGIFEGTVRHNTEDNSYNVLGISRISMYGSTSWCIDSPTLKIFCYCKIQQLT